MTSVGLVLLQKTLLNIEGLGRELYPDFDLWGTAKPFLEEWYKEKIGPKATARRIKDKLPHWAEQLPEIPEMLHQVLSDYRWLADYCCGHYSWVRWLCS